MSYSVLRKVNGEKIQPYGKVVILPENWVFLIVFFQIKRCLLVKMIQANSVLHSDGWV